MDLPRFIGHRGAAARAPENTLAGFDKAAALGLTWVEVDVRLTRDRRLVLMHDATLDRTTDGAGRVAATDLADIRHLDAGGWFAPEFRMEPVPLLEEALERAAALRLGVNIEAKSDPGLEAETGQTLAAGLADLPTELPLLVSSFDMPCLAAFRRSGRAAPVGLLLEAWRDDWRDAMDAVGAAALHVAKRALTADRVRAVKATGVPLLSFTVNDPARAETLFAWGVDTLFTDAPDGMPI